MMVVQGENTRGSVAVSEFELDVRLVEYGPVAAVLLGDTDDGCDTKKDGDC